MLDLSRLCRVQVIATYRFLYCPILLIIPDNEFSNAFCFNLKKIIINYQYICMFYLQIFLVYLLVNYYAIYKARMILCNFTNMSTFKMFHLENHFALLWWSFTVSRLQTIINILIFDIYLTIVKYTCMFRLFLACLTSLLKFRNIFNHHGS